MSKTVQELCEEFKIDRDNYRLRIDESRYQSNLDNEKSFFEDRLMEHFKELDFDTYAKLRTIELLKHQNEFLETIATKLYGDD